MSGNKAIFLDRDGTINIDKDYLYRIQDFKFIPKAPEAMKLLQDAGYKLFIITNQSGIARGYYTEDDYKVLNDWLLSTLVDKYDVHITASYYCPHLPTSHTGFVVEKYGVDCNCRKPKIGLFTKAITEHNIDLSSSYAIGDKLRDLAICGRYENFSDIRSGCKGFLVGSKESDDVINRVKAGEIENIRYAESLYEAAVAIISSPITSVL